MTTHGELFADATTREIRGLILPFDELSSLNVSGTEPVMFSADADVTFPRDVSMMGLNLEHDRFAFAGRGVNVEKTPDGYVASFFAADTDEGDEALQGIASGRWKKLSPEIIGMVRDGAKGLKAHVAHVGLVSRSAFESAALFSLAPDELVPQLVDDELVPTPSPDVAPATPESTPDAAPVAPDTAGAPAEDKENTVTDAVIPTGAPAPSPAVQTAEREPSRGELFAMIDAVQGGRASREVRETVHEYLQTQGSLFALADVDYDGAAGVGAKMSPSAWLGEVEDGTTYRQRYVPLFGSKTLTSLSMSGFGWTTKPQGGTWTGNKDAIPSNTPVIAAKSANAVRWAGGHDIAREHRDFGTPGFFESYNAAMRESFDRWLDETVVLTSALAAATDVVADDPTGLSIGAGLSALIDGAAEVVEAGLIPTSAVVATALWKSIMKTPSSDVLGYLNASLGFTDGELDGFVIAPAPITAGHTLVIAKSAADVYTLPGSPIRAEALNIGNGGIDIGHFGYGGLHIKNAAGIVDVAPFAG